MQSINNYDCYKMVKRNHDAAQKKRLDKRRRNLTRATKAIEITIVLFSIFVACQWLAGF